MVLRRVRAVVLGFAILMLPTSSALAGGASGAKGALAGTNWVLREIEGRGVLPAPRATLTFESAEKVGGDGSCNRFFGAVEIDGSAIAFGPLGATRRACGEAIDDQEISYLGALAKAAAFSLENDALVILAADETRLLRFDRAD